MRDDPKKIKIDTVHGGDPRDHQALKRNYFLPTTVNDTYLFYAPSNDLIPTDPPVLATGRDFSFELRRCPESPGASPTSRSLPRSPMAIGLTTIKSKTMKGLSWPRQEELSRKRPRLPAGS